MESGAWASAYYDEPFHTRRAAKLPARLRRLGVLDLPVDTRILDACCGKGEALKILRARGFRHLAGADGQGHPEWAEFPDTQYEVSDVRSMPFRDASFDAVINVHALHHMRSPHGVAQFVEECARVLRPGGTLHILDFPGSLPVKLIFRLLQGRFAAVTPGLRNLARILDEEWSYLPQYLNDWPRAEQALRRSSLRVSSWRYEPSELFLYYSLILVKPPE